VKVLLSAVFASVVASALSPVAFSSGNREVAGLPYQDSDAYEVYAVLLPKEGEFWSKSKLILIQQETEKEIGPIQQKKCFQADDRFQAKYAELLDDYNAKNNQSWLLESRKTLPHHPSKQARTRFSVGILAADGKTFS
jgi:hypothetical protein